MENPGHKQLGHEDYPLVSTEVAKTTHFQGGFLSPIAWSACSRLWQSALDAQHTSFFLRRNLQRQLRKRRKLDWKNANMHYIHEQVSNLHGQKCLICQLCEFQFISWLGLPPFSVHFEVLWMIHCHWVSGLGDQLEGWSCNDLTCRQPTAWNVHILELPEASHANVQCPTRRTKVSPKITQATNPSFVFPSFEQSKKLSASDGSGMSTSSSLQPIPQGKKSLNTDRNIPKPVTLQHVATGCPGQPFCSKPLSVPLPRQIASYPPLPGAKSAVTLSWLRMVENGIPNDSLGHAFWEYLISVNIS